MPDTPGYLLQREDSLDAFATLDSFGPKAALGSSCPRAQGVDVIAGTGAGIFPSGLAIPADRRIVVMGCSLYLPAGCAGASPVNLEMLQAGNALLSIPDGVGFAAVAVIVAPTAPGAPLIVHSGIPSGSQLVSSAGSGVVMHQINSALPAGTPFEAFVYYSVVRSGDIPVC